MQERWPKLNQPGWQATADHLRLWSQLLGKTRLAFAPEQNHWWHITLRVSPRGLTTGTIPLPDGRTFDLELDLLAHRLLARTSDRLGEKLPLADGSMARFYDRYLQLLEDLDIHPRLYPRPVESVEAIPFESDREMRPYDSDWATAYFRATTEINRLLEVFRGQFVGKASPVHFFWGAFDLAATRFSGRRAPRHRGGTPNCPDRVQIEAYSHECSSAGFWPGGAGFPEAALYSYAYPEPPGFADADVLPADAFYSREAGEFLLPYEVVRTSGNPERAALSFFQSTYVAAAEAARWNRRELERAEAPAAGDETWLRDAPTSHASTSSPPP